MNYSRIELESLGLGHIGRNVLLHKTAILISPENIFIGDNARIDCHSLLSAGSQGLHIGRNVHIAAGCYLFGSSAHLGIEDFVGVSSRTTIYTGSDDFSEGYMNGPTLPSKYRKVKTGDVVLRRHVLIGANCTILPGVTVGEGASVGAMSLISKNVKEWHLMAGNPMMFITMRNKEKLLSLEALYLEENG